MDKFTLEWERAVPELASTAKLFTHNKTKAQVLFLVNDDEEKVFSTVFKTTSNDSTGVAHIMEHSVLGGSAKYQVKEPFVHLLKSSVNSYVNAWTSSEMTAYPVASANEADFTNLVSVYLDAIFAPTLSETTFKQEGWRYELDDDNGELSYGGVVFNEMKGSNASPQRINSQGVRQGLLPGTIYEFNSGGDSQVIPELSYQEFKNYYDRYYHPSNSYTYVYGKVSIEKILAQLEEYLEGFEYQQVDTSVEKSPKFSEPRQVSVEYPVTEISKDKGQYFAQLAWALDVEQPVDKLKWEILDDLLTGSDAAPLRKALIESNLGEGLSGGGFYDYLYQQMYLKGLKGVKAEDIQAVQNLIIDALETLKDGFDPKLIEAAMNSLEFSFREVTESGVMGISIMYLVLDGWLTGKDPLQLLEFDELFGELRKQYADNPNLFGDLVKSDLLDNPHRLDFSMQPSATWASDKDASEKQKLAQLQQEMSEQELVEIKAQTLEIKTIQETPDAEEDIAKIPRLEVADLDKTSTVVETKIENAKQLSFYIHNQPTRGITYFDIAFDTSWMSQDDLFYYAILMQLQGRLDTQNFSYEQLAIEMDTYTGGISETKFSGAVFDQDAEYFLTTINGKALHSNRNKMLDLMLEIVNSTKFEDTQRIKQLLQQRKSGVESRVVSNGLNWSFQRANAKVSKYSAINEYMYGVDSYWKLKDLIDNFDSRSEQLTAKLHQLQQRIAASKLVTNFTDEPGEWNAFRDVLTNKLSGENRKDDSLYLEIQNLEVSDEGLTVPSEVSFVSLAMDLKTVGYQRHGSNSAIQQILRLDYLWNEVRAKGGAYGVAYRVSNSTLAAGFGSYRDPNLAKTLEVYRNAGKFLMEHDFTQRQIDGAIIGAVGSIDQPETAAEKGWTGFTRQYNGWTDDLQQKYRTELLNTSLKDIRAYGEMLDQAAKEGVVVVLGSKDKLEEYNKAGGDLKLSEFI